MINAPWAVIIFLKALNCNPYWKQEASSYQQYKCLEMTKYSVFSKIHRNLSKFKYSVLCEMLTITWKEALFLLEELEEDSKTLLISQKFQGKGFCKAESVQKVKSCWT